MTLESGSQTYAVCENCKRLNRVQVVDRKSPVCGSCKSELPLQGAVVEGSDSTLHTLINKSPVAVVVDAWAPWCGPCRAFTPTFEEFSNRYTGKIVFVKLNVDENQQTAVMLGIRGIPTLIVFNGGAEIARQSGAIPREQFGQWLEQYAK